MSKRNVDKVGFDTEIFGKDVSIEFTRTTVWGWENYGADADGNRGMMMLMIDADETTDITASWDDEATGNAHNMIPYAELPKTWQVAVAEAIDLYVETHEPNEPEEQEREYEPEDHLDYWEND